MVIGVPREIKDHETRVGLVPSGAAALRELPAVRLPVLPRQPQAGPALEKVELTPAEQDAFAGLIRRLGDH